MAALLAHAVGLDVRLLAIAADLAIGPTVPGALEVARILALRPAGPVPRALALNTPAKIPAVQATPAATISRPRTSGQVPAHVHAAVVRTAAHVSTLISARTPTLLLAPAVYPPVVPRPVAPTAPAMVRPTLAVPALDLPRLGHGLAPSAFGPRSGTTLFPTGPSTLAALLDVAIQVAIPKAPSPSAPSLVLPSIRSVVAHARCEPTIA